MRTAAFLGLAALCVLVYLLWLQQEQIKLLGEDMFDLSARVDDVSRPRARTRKGGDA